MSPPLSMSFHGGSMWKIAASARWLHIWIAAIAAGRSGFGGNPENPIKYDRVSDDCGGSAGLGAHDRLTRNSDKIGYGRTRKALMPLIDTGTSLVKTRTQPGWRRKSLRTERVRVFTRQYQC